MLDTLNKEFPGLKWSVGATCCTAKVSVFMIEIVQLHEGCLGLVNVRGIGGTIVFSTLNQVGISFDEVIQQVKSWLQSQAREIDEAIK